MEDLSEDNLDELLLQRDGDVENKIWTQKDGKRVKVSNMEDSHIINTIKYLKRVGFTNIDDWVIIFNDEAKKRKLL